MNPNLIKLLVSNKGKGFFRAETTTDTATIYLYDTITSDPYWGGVTALDFARALASINVPEIHLRIDSPGGDVFAARSMAQAIMEHTSKIMVHVDGLAASAATLLAVAADDSVISAGGMFMIHNAWTMTMGNANDFLEIAALLERIDISINANYVEKTGKTADQIKQWMDAETSFIGQEAVANGFINSIAKIAPKNKIKWDLSAYGIEQRIENKQQNDNDDEIENESNIIIYQKNTNRLRIAQALITH